MNKIGSFFHRIIKHEDGTDTAFLRFYKKDSTKSVLASIISIAIGLVFGLIMMIVISFFTEETTISSAFKGIIILIKGPFNYRNFNYTMCNLGNAIFYSVPLIMTGLSVALAYKTGLFNIGAPGQFVMGTIGCMLVALSIDTTGNRPLGVLVWLLAVIVGMIMGMIWGIIPGILKAFFNINEVIVCIMTNWIAANIATWLFTGSKFVSTAESNSAYLKVTSETGNYTPNLGFDKLFYNSYLDIGIFIAIAIAIVIYIILNKTTFGYELKACGSNREASRYAGLNEKRNIIISMALAGGLAAIGAALYYLNPGIEYKYESQYASLPSYGFNGIASAFLANCNPIGVVVSSLFIRFINMGGESLVKVGFNRYVADIIVAIIIYLAGFSRIFKDLLSKTKVNKKDNSAREGGRIEKKGETK